MEKENSSFDKGVSSANIHCRFLILTYFHRCVAQFITLLSPLSDCITAYSAQFHMHISRFLTSSRFIWPLSSSVLPAKTNRAVNDLRIHPRQISARALWAF